MNAHCDQLDAFVDGELDGDAAAAFRDHLASCGRCQGGLHARLQLDALAALTAETAETAAAAPAPPRVREAEVIALAGRRSRRFRSAALFALPALAAAAVVALYLAKRGPRPGAPVAAGPGAAAGLGSSLSATRSIEARLSAPEADRHRPYGVLRSGAAPRETISHRVLAALEDRHDTAGLVAAYVLMGERERAKAALEALPPAPASDSDRAALALASGEPERALLFAQRALGEERLVPQAEWNRALALRDLGLSLAAAAVFEGVATRQEPGWADEARARAADLAADGARRAALLGRVEAAGEALVATGTVPAPELVAAYPGLLRLYLYHALRTAPSVERVRALAGLAEALDRDAGAGAPGPLGALVARVAAADFARRAPLAAGYLKLRAEGFSDGAAVDRLLAAARRAGPAGDDIRLGTLIMAGRAGATGAAGAEVLALVRASADPWFLPMPGVWQARASTDRAQAAELLRQALAACTVDYRAAQIELDLANTLLVDFHRPAEARTLVASALTRVRRLGDWQQESVLLSLAAQIAEFAGDWDLARAHVDESLARVALVADEAATCADRRYLYLKLAKIEIARVDLGAAAKAARRAPRCGEPILLDHAWAMADARAFLDEAEVGALVRELAARLDEGTLSPSDRAIAETIRGRALTARDRRAGEVVLRQAIAAAADPQVTPLAAQRVRTQAFTTLILLAGAAQELPGALSLFTEEAGLGALPRTCLLGAAVDDDQTLVVAAGADGQVVGAHGRRHGPRLDAGALVPPAVVERLRACAEVAVIARPPLWGLELLPPDLAWRFVAAGAPGAAPVPTAPPRRLVIADVRPPAELGLPPLLPRRAALPAGTVLLTGADATPERVLAEMTKATEIELDVHGLSDAGADGAYLALSPQAGGRFALTAQDVRATRLRGRPLVILGACDAAQGAAFAHEAWSLPIAFVTAGAAAVLAATVPIPDAEAEPLFAAIRRRVAAGATPAMAVRDTRVEFLQKDPRSFAAHVLAFQAVWE